MKKRISIIVGVILVLFLIMVLLPDSFFQKHSKYGWFYESDMFKNNNGKEATASWSVTLDEMMEKLLKNKYSYSYNLENRSYKYICSGTKDGDKDNGSCTSPEEVSYSNENFSEVFNRVNTSYLDVSYIYGLIKDVEGESIQYQETREYYYQVVSNDVDTEIYIYTTEESIYKIQILNSYLTYIIEYKDIKD